MTNVGWIVPSHPPRLEKLNLLINSFLEYSTNIDLIIVWTRKSDNQLPNFKNIKSIYLDEYFNNIDLELLEKTRSIINVKKIFGIMHEYEKYDGLFCTDDEVEFTQSFSGQKLLEDFSIRKVFPATDIGMVKSKDDIIQRILTESCKLILDEKDREIIKFATNNYKLFGWFADIPFYDCRDVKNFLKKYGLSDYKSLLKLNFFTFDHILYQYYKIFSGESTYHELNWIYDKPGAYNWFECLHLSPLNLDYIHEYEKKFAPRWASSRDLTNYFVHAICVFHTDRVNLRFSRYLLIKHNFKLLVFSAFPWLDKYISKYNYKFVNL